MSMEDVASDQVPKCASHYNIGGEVLPGQTIATDRRK